MVERALVSKASRVRGAKSKGSESKASKEVDFWCGFVAFEVIGCSQPK